jgi:hypothetical protein
MPRRQAFDLSAARLLIEQALTGGGYDVMCDPAEPNLVQARRGDLGDVITVVVDAGGRMRFTRVRRLGPEEAAERRLARDRAARMVRRTDETLTLLVRLIHADVGDFSALLAELETV